MPPNAPRKPPAVPWPVMAVVVVVLLAVIAWLLIRSDGKDAATEVRSSGSSSPAPTSIGQKRTGEQIAGVNGCLGGKDPSVAIYTALKAPLTRSGAVSFLATVERWAALWPKPDGQQAQLAPKVLSSRMVRTLDREKIPSGAKRWGDTTGSAYKITDFSGNTATIAMTVDTIATYRGQKTTATNASVYTLGTQDGHWILMSAKAPLPGTHDPRKNIAAVKEGSTQLPRGCN